MSYSITRTASGQWRVDNPSESSRLYTRLLEAVAFALPRPGQFGPSDPITTESLATEAAEIDINPAVPEALAGWYPTKGGELCHRPSGYITSHQTGIDWGAYSEQHDSREEVEEAKRYTKALNDWERQNIPR